MPIVGNKKFDYTPEGKASAKAYAKKTGLPMSCLLYTSDAADE